MFFFSLFSLVLQNLYYILPLHTHCLFNFYFSLNTKKVIANNYVFTEAEVASSGQLRSGREAAERRGIYLPLATDIGVSKRQLFLVYTKTVR